MELKKFVSNSEQGSKLIIVNSLHLETKINHFYLLTNCINFIVFTCVHSTFFVVQYYC